MGTLEPQPHAWTASALQQRLGCDAAGLEALLTQWASRLLPGASIDVQVDTENDGVAIFRWYAIVDTVTNEQTEVTLAAAQEVDPSFELHDDLGVLLESFLEDSVLPELLASLSTDTE